MLAQVLYHDLLELVWSCLTLVLESLNPEHSCKKAIFACAWQNESSTRRSANKQSLDSKRNFAARKWRKATSTKDLRPSRSSN